MKIIADTQARNYELTYLIPETFTEGERSAIDQEIAELVQKKYKGSVISSEDWGKKRLTYTMKFQSAKISQAYYTHMVVQLLPDQVQGLEREVQLHARILRHLLVLATSSNKEETASAE